FSEIQMCFTCTSCCGFPIKEASLIFASVLCGAAVIGFGFSLFNVVIYIIHGVVPWLMLLPLSWTLIQFFCYFFVFSACSTKNPARMIPAVVFSGLACLGMVGCIAWSLIFIIQQGYVPFFWFDWQIGWPVPVAAGVAVLFFLGVFFTMFAAFKFIKEQRIEMARLAAQSRYTRGDWKGDV
ncbi:hypothetical protein PENTCL1PPCAC_22006, partial [Pristionchus entomophagus]